MLISTPLCSHCRSRCRWVQRPIINSSSRGMPSLLTIYVAYVYMFSTNTWIKMFSEIIVLLSTKTWIKMFIKQHNKVVFNKNIAHFLYDFFSFTFFMPNLDITNSFGWLPLRQSTEIMSLSALTIFIFRLFKKLCSITTLSWRNMVQTVVPLDIMVCLRQIFRSK